MLSVSELTIDIKGRQILTDISFSLRQGESLAIMGPSGCGKTTLLKAISGFIPSFSQGHISYKGILWQDSQKEYFSARQRPATLLFQELAVWPHLKIKRQLDLVVPKNLAQTPKAAFSTEAILSELMLAHLANTIGRDLSGGEKQRLALGRVIKTMPEIMLLDEPFASLDKDTKSKTIDLIKQIKEKSNCTLIIATHDINEAKLLSGSFLKLKQN